MTEVYDAGAWTYETLEQHTPDADFGPFKEFVALWRSKWNGDALPAWRDFDFEDFAGWYGWLIVEDIIPGGKGDVRFRLWGTNVTEIFNMDATGKTMSEMGEEWFDPEEYDLVTRIAEEGIIVRSTGNLAWRGREFTTVSTLELPLADDGKNIDRILCGVTRID